MSKSRKIIMMLAKGESSKTDTATALHVIKRDVSAASASSFPISGAGKISGNVRDGG